LVRPGTQEHAIHEPLIRRAMLAEVPLAGLFFGDLRVFRLNTCLEFPHGVADMLCLLRLMDSKFAATVKSLQAALRRYLVRTCRYHFIEE
jgi:hypothetical protein